MKYIGLIVLFLLVGCAPGMQQNNVPMSGAGQPQGHRGHHNSYNYVNKFQSPCTGLTGDLQKECRQNVADPLSEPLGVMKNLRHWGIAP